MHCPIVNEIKVTHQIVLLRIDGNVPMDASGQISNDYRLQSIRPTLDYLLSQNATVILLTHRGRPDLSKSIVSQESLSNKQLIPWFIKQNYTPLFFEKIEDSLRAAKEKKASLILLENLRFFKEEKEQNLQWAEQFTNIASIYVNDALSILHRTDASVTLFPQLIKTKAIGFALQKELQILEKLTKKVNQPFVIILGGNKSDKLFTIKKILEKPKESRPAKILCGGMIGLYFLMAEKQLKKNNEIELINHAAELSARAKEQNVELILPIDHHYKNDLIIDIGPHTIARFENEIKNARTIFFNGTMGIYEKPEGKAGTRALLTTTAESNAFSVVGGGNAVDAVFHEKMENQFSWISTGGGATLAFIAAQNPYTELPGLAALLKKE